MLNETAETKLRIVHALIKANKPLGVSDIGRSAGLGREKVRYHMDDLVRWGLIIPDNDTKTYIAQPLFQERPLLTEELSPLISVISLCLIYDHSESKDEAITNFLTFFLAFLAFDIDENGEPKVKGATL